MRACCWEGAHFGFWQRRAKALPAGMLFAFCRLLRLRLPCITPSSRSSTKYGLTESWDPAAFFADRVACPAALWSAALGLASARVGMLAHWPSGVALGFVGGVAVEHCTR